MKAYKLIPILAVTLLVPSFAEAKHSTRNKQRHRTERIYRQGPPPWAPAYGHRAKHTVYIAMAEVSTGINTTGLMIATTVTVPIDVTEEESTSVASL